MKVTTSKTPERVVATDAALVDGNKPASLTRGDRYDTDPSTSTSRPRQHVAVERPPPPPKRGLRSEWPAGLTDAQKKTLDGLKRLPATPHTLSDVLKSASFQTLSDEGKRAVLAAAADQADRVSATGAKPTDVISSLAVTAGVLNPNGDAAMRERTLVVASAVKPADLDAFLFAHQAGVLDRADANGTTVRDHLVKLATQPIADGLDRSELIGQISRDLSDTTRIHQGKRNTCGATSCSILLAQQRPAEYARLLTELARPEGTALLPDGTSQIAVKRDALTDDSQRTITGRLLQPALMEFANGKANYDNATEKHTRKLPKNIPGLTQPEVVNLANALLGDTLGGSFKKHGAGMGFGDVVQAITPGGRPFEPAAWQSLLEGKKPAVALLDVDRGTFHIPAKGFHWVVVQEIKDGRVYFDDPNRVTNDDVSAGRRTRPGDYRVEMDGRASMPVKDFAKVLWTMVAPQ